MARIIENNLKRRLIRLSFEDIASIITGWQMLKNANPYKSTEEIEKIYKQNPVFLPEEM